MEVVGIKRSRNRKKRKHVKKRRRDQVKFEVKSFKQRRHDCEKKTISFAKEKLIQSTMQADSFWENYTAAQEWQKRHSVTWWRSRCFALEYENQILRDKIRSLVSENNQQHPQTIYNNKQNMEEDDDEEEDEGENNVENESFEFHVNEDMLSFLEQSIRHKMELKKKKESESMAAREENAECTKIRGGAAWIRERNEGAKLLYGESSATILAMETALQATIDRHEDKAKPQYWPVIPLKP